MRIVPEYGPQWRPRLGMGVVVWVAAMLLSSAEVRVIKIGITPEDVDRALSIARSREADRQGFHAPYIQALDTPFIERVEVVSELRRVVLLAEEQIARGDHRFAYSLTRATDALEVWRRRVAIVARVRFHPQNNYVDAPPVTIRLAGNDGARIGIKRDAILALPPGRTGEFVPVLGAVVEGVFEAQALGQSVRDFVIELDGRELGRVTFDFAAID
ncbi:MAG TPA: hypothetical protein VMO26_21975 [Vicinamibacterales bacterium]|nr:hypothetical protein [Vicinamibacterales bacterium]